MASPSALWRVLVWFSPVIIVAQPPSVGSTLLVTCPSLSAPLRGQMKQNSLTYMSSVHFWCDAGYGLSGSKTRQCQADGQWDGEPAMCTDASRGGACQGLVTPYSGSKNSTDFSIGSAISFSCNARFIILGSAVRICGPKFDPLGRLASVTWTGVQPICKFEGDPLQERAILEWFFQTTNGHLWHHRTRRVDMFTNNDLYSNNAARNNSRYSIRITTEGLDPDWKPIETTIEQRTVGWNSSTENGCNTDTCHCSWFGVTCNDDGVVTRLELPANGLTGNIPAELGGLPYLQVLRLENNQLTGTIPNGLAGPVNNLTHFPVLQMHGERSGLEALQVLHLWGNNLDGPLPETMNNLHITELHVNDNRLTGLMSNWSGLTNLKSLRIQRNQIVGTIPESMGDMLKIVEIRAYDNFMTGSIPSVFGYLENLEHLELHNNYLEADIATSLSSIRFMHITPRSRSNNWSPCGTRVGGSSYLGEQDTSASSFAPSCCYTGRSPSNNTAILPAVYNPICMPALSPLFSPEYGNTTQCPHGMFFGNELASFKKATTSVTIGEAVSNYVSAQMRPILQGFHQTTYWHCTWPGRGRPLAITIDPTTVTLDTPTTFVVAGSGLSRADRVKVVEPVAPCRGRGDEDTLMGGRARYLEWVSEDRLAGNVTFTIYLPQLTNGDVVPVKVCYLYDGSSEFTQFATLRLVSNQIWWPEDQRPVDTTYGINS